MNILALDLATVTGFAMGNPPENLSDLRSGQFSVKPHYDIDDTVEDLAQRALNLEAFLTDIFMFKEAWPDLVIYEAPRDPNAKAQDERGDHNRVSASIILPFVLACKVVEFCRVRQVRVEKVWPQSWRPSFLGKATATKGQDIKKLVIRQAETFGYLPTQTPLVQNNRADAIGIWHHGQVKYGRWQPPTEIMFGKAVPVLGGTR